MTGGRRVEPGVAGERTVLGYPLADRIVIILGFPLVGLAVAIGLPVLARWLLDLSVPLPVRPAFRVVGSVDRPVEIAVNVAIWMALGVWAAFAAIVESLTVTLTGAELRFDLDGRSWTVPRAEVAAAFVDGRTLVVLDRGSRQVVRERHEASAGRLAAAFRAHGYPWQEADPYERLYQRWSPGGPDLPEAVDTVLGVRADALRRRAGRQAGQLREAVEKLGFAVRDEGGQQYWRPLVRS